MAAVFPHPVLALDLGGVVFLPDSPMQISEHTLQRISDLVRLFGPEHSYIISKAGPKMEANARTALERHDFYHQTGFLEPHLHFCLTRSEKAPLALHHRVTHFVDDRSSVHQYLTNVPYRFKFPHRKDNHLVPGIRLVDGWESLIPAIQSTL